MATPTRRQPKTRKKYEPVNDRLLEMAARLFSAQGFQVGIDKILANSKVAKMSLYINFGSKYGLIEKLLETAEGEWQAEIRRSVGDRSSSDSSLAVLLESLCNKVRNPGSRVGLLPRALVDFANARDGTETGKKKEKIFRRAESMKQSLIAQVETLAASQAFRDPALAAQQLMLLTTGYFVAGTGSDHTLVLAAALESFAAFSQRSYPPFETKVEPDHPVVADRTVNRPPRLRRISGAHPEFG